MDERSVPAVLVAALLAMVSLSLVALPSVAIAEDDAVATEAVAAEEVVATEVAEVSEEVPDEEVAASPALAFLDDVNVLWTCLAAFLVFFMQAGFAMVEAGFTRAKNACNIIMKNLMDLSVGSLLFWMVGFGLMFGVSNASGLIGTNNFFFSAESEAAQTSGNSVAFNWAFLIFQTVFCATAATIVSGAMAERTRFTSYLLYSAAICAIVYPIFGHWAWGSLFGEASTGWLEGWGFYDFAGSTVVHSIGGWAALAGAIVIGPRIGKYSKDGKLNPIPGHNIPMGAMGVFILWLGWFGFNAGSTTAIDGGGLAVIAVATNIAAAAGAVSAMITSWIFFRKPDPSLSLNGALAGLVAITAGCDVMTPTCAALVGGIGGVIVVASVVFFDRIKIDDPVGAISVHGVCGAWGTLAVGLFGTGMGLFVGGGSTQLVAQAVGIGAGFLWAFPVSFAIFSLIKATAGLRVSAEEEIEGLDVREHGILAYPPAMVAESYTRHGIGSPSYPPVAPAPAPAPVPTMAVSGETQ